LGFTKQRGRPSTHRFPARQRDDLPLHRLVEQGPLVSLRHEGAQLFDTPNDGGLG
jgi:hypothetical protein